MNKDDRIALDFLLRTDRELLLIAGGATHQHYKGGLYKLLGPLWSADSGQRFEVPVNMNEGLYEPVVAYQHLAPNARDVWMRRASEFDGWVEVPDWHPSYTNHSRIRRFRPIGREWWEA